MALAVRRAQLADRIAMRTLLTTQVGGVSPLDELRAEWGDVPDIDLATIEKRIQRGDWWANVCYDNGTLRGWTYLTHSDGLRDIGIHAPDAWAGAFVITDKRLDLLGRLAVVGAITVFAAREIDPGDYIWCDVKTPGQLDNLYAGRTRFYAGSPFVAVEAYGQACHRYYDTAAEILRKSGG
jgi:hypothetical protein